MTHNHREKSRTRALLFFFFFATLALASSVHAESRPEASSAASWLAGASSQMLFSRSGGAYLPSSVLQGMRDGKVSAIQQFTLANQIMNKCTADVVKFIPPRNAPLATSKLAFQEVVCRLQKCFQHGMLVLLLPSLSSNVRAGGSADEGTRSGAKQQALVLAQAFQKQDKCGSGQGDSLDPLILTLVQR